MINEFIRTHTRAVVITGLILIAGLTIYAITTYVQRSGKIAVTVSIVPNDATSTLDGKPITSSGTIYLNTGTYSFKTSKDGFTSVNQSVYVGPSANSINFSLTPETAAAAQWAKDNQAAYQKNEETGGAAADLKGSTSRAKNPIISDLPYTNTVYTIGMINDPSDPSGTSIIITIDAPEGYRNAALEQIRSFGYNPEQFKYKFYNYTDPFSS